MSAFDLLSFRSLSEPTTPAPAATSPAELPRGDETRRSFRDTLDAEPNRAASARSEREPVSAETAAESTARDTESPSDSDPSAEASERPAPTDDIRTSEDRLNAEPSESAALASDELDEEVSPVADLVLDLIAAFENVLENNPLAQAGGEVGVDGGEGGGAFPGLTALFEALSAVSAVTGAAAGQSVTGSAVAGAATAGQAVAPIANSANLSAGNAPVLSVTPEGAAAQTQTDGESSGNPNSNGNTPGGNPALQAGEPGALAVNSSTTPGITLPGLEAAAINTAAQPITPLINATPNGTDISARLNPAGLTDAASSQDAANSARLTRGLNNAVNQQGGTVTLRLTPPDIGTVRIQLNLQGTSVSAQFHAETDAGQRLLTQQLGQLRTSLESQGLNVEKLGVQGMSSSSNSSSLQQQSNGDNPQSQTNADGRSRGQFGQSSQQNNQGRGDNPDDNAAPASFTQLLTPEAESDVADSLTGAAST